jgi:predicted nucleic acid-binding protein
VEAEVFLDSSYAIALAAVTDEYHDQAISIAEELEQVQTRLITTRAILLEIGNALAKPRYRPAAVRMLVSLDSDPSVEIVPLTEQIYSEALLLYQNRSDKDWGLTDCVSFVVMGFREIKEALTADHHFEQAGFRALLCKDGV